MVPIRYLVFQRFPIPITDRHIRVQTAEFDPDTPPSSRGFTARVPLLRTPYASLTPTCAISSLPLRLSPGFEPLPLGSDIPNGIIVRVLRSDTSTAPLGKLLVGTAPIQTRHIQKSHGIPGPTVYSYAALYEIAQPRVDEIIFVLAAVGAVGQMVGQLAKCAGLTVIGSAGSDKVNLLARIWGFGGVFNHRDGDINVHLKMSPCNPKWD